MGRTGEFEDSSSRQDGDSRIEPMLRKAPVVASAERAVLEKSIRTGFAAFT